MITIILVHNAKSEKEFEDFLKSLSYSHSKENDYEVLSDKTLPGFENIKFVSEKSSDSKIQITLPDDCLVLANSWDKYIVHALENGLPQGGIGKNYVPGWEGYVQRRMGLQSRRPPEGIFPDLKVSVATE